MMIIKLIFVIFCLVPVLCFGYGNHQTLEITNIKSAGGGTPALSEHNRIFKAYPGITYTVPVGVIGGTFPYTFVLSNAPSGMSINARTGVVTWTNPQTSASNITVTVYDKTNTSTSATWSITVGTSGFIFVDDDASPGGDGTITTPYDTIQDVLDIGSSAVNSIVYFRAGAYAVPRYNGVRSSPGLYGCNLLADGGRAHIWIGYPGETIVLNMGGVNENYAWWFETSTDVAGRDNVWFENITIQSPREWGFRHHSGSYFTLYNIVMDDLVGSSFTGNSGGFYSSRAGNVYYTHIVDCSFTDFVTAHHVGSLYVLNKTLIERNTFNGTNGPSIVIKEDVQYTTVRRNQFLNCTSAYGSSTNAVFNYLNTGCNYNEFCYNYVDTAIDWFNNDNNQGETWFYRNTLVGGTLYMKNLDYPSSCEGPWAFENNVFQNSAEGLSYHYTCGNNPASCVSMANNLNGTTGIVDASGNLQGDYTSYLGTSGWQVGDSEYSNNVTTVTGCTISGASMQ